MKKTFIALVVLLSALITPTALAAKPKCTNQELKTLNNLAIEYNDNRAYFLKYVVYAREANDGLVRTRQAGDASNEASFRESFSIATVNAKKTASNGKYIETQMRKIMAKCVSGYGISYTSDYGLLKMNASIKGVKFPTYLIPRISVQPLASSSSSNAATNQSSSNSAKLSNYFGKLAWSWKDKSSRTMLIECNFMPTGASIRGLRAIMIMSANQTSLASGQQWFPKTFSENYASKVRTWESASAPFLYIDLEPVSVLSDPCKVEVRNVPVILGSDSPYWVGPDVYYVGLALVDSTNTLAMVGSFNRWNYSFTTP
jgi:hypothetical protein